MNESHLFTEVHGHNVRAHVEALRRGVVTARALLDDGGHLRRGGARPLRLLAVAVVRGVPVPVAAVTLLWSQLNFFLTYHGQM